jgi:hypothetical protein
MGEWIWIEVGKETRRRMDEERWKATKLTSSIVDCTLTYAPRKQRPPILDILDSTLFLFLILYGTSIKNIGDSHIWLAFWPPFSYSFHPSNLFLNSWYDQPTLLT